MEDDLERARRAVTSCCGIVIGLDPEDDEQHREHAGQHHLEARIRRKALDVASALRPVAQHASRDLRWESEDDEVVQALRANPAV
jgi:hypothetical protein